MRSRIGRLGIILAALLCYHGAAVGQSTTSTAPDMVVKVDLPQQGGLPQWAVILLQGSVGALVGSSITFFGVWLTNENNRETNERNREQQFKQMKWQWHQQEKTQSLQAVIKSLSNISFAIIIMDKTSDTVVSPDQMALLLHNAEVASVFVSKECNNRIDAVCRAAIPLIRTVSATEENIKLFHAARNQFGDACRAELQTLS